MLKPLRTALKPVARGVKAFLERNRLHRLQMATMHLEYFAASGKGLPLTARAIAFEMAAIVLDRVRPRRECPVCGFKGFEFSPIAFAGNYRAATRCPSCRTYERHRILALHLRDRPAPAGGRTLFIGPNKKFSDTLFPDAHHSLDIYPYPHVDVIGDLGALPFGRNAYDTIVCFRVMEHVPEDRRALESLARILTPEGKLFLSVPLYDGITETYDYTGDRETCPRGPTWSYPDHARDYAIKDFEQRITGAGLLPARIVPEPDSPDARRFKTVPDNDTTGRAMGLAYMDVVYECTRADTTG